VLLCFHRLLVTYYDSLSAELLVGKATRASCRGCGTNSPKQELLRDGGHFDDKGGLLYSLAESAPSSAVARVSLFSTVLWMRRKGCFRPFNFVVLLAKYLADM